MTTAKFINRIAYKSRKTMVNMNEHYKTAHTGQKSKRKQFQNAFQSTLGFYSRMGMATKTIHRPLHNGG